MLRTALICCSILLLAVIVAAHLTLNFSAWTSEDVRRQRIATTPLELPEFDLLDAQGEQYRFKKNIQQGGKYVLLGFIYTRCTTVCTQLGNEFQQLQREIILRNLGDRVSLLSISFDPTNDTPLALQNYAKRMNADSKIWRFASVKDQRQLQTLLKSVGIVVIPDGFGGWTHNAAIQVVRPDGSLIRIVDVTDIGHALALVADSSVQP